MYYSLAQIWPIADSSFPLLQYIDPYGNTIFNGAQMPQVKNELSLLIERAPKQEQKEVLRLVLDLATVCGKHPHLFLRFHGD
jgi:hypothetical protein